MQIIYEIIFYIFMYNILQNIFNIPYISIFNQNTEFNTIKCITSKRTFKLYISCNYKQILL